MVQALILQTLYGECLNSESSSVDEIPNEIIEAEPGQPAAVDHDWLSQIGGRCRRGNRVTQAFAIKGAVDPGIVPTLTIYPPTSFHLVLRVVLEL